MKKLILLIVFLAAVWGFLNVSAYYAGKADPYTMSGSYLSNYSNTVHRYFEAVRVPYYSCDTYVNPKGPAPVCGWNRGILEITV